ncbi:class I SAM-dependent methyltransferase [Brevibacillus laterosporus]|uniref:Methyltransferase domain-containing protein n=1 Tax=Brevibacillus halotolerans TaxID=1507437 RepID=A0ABT4HWM2_9BACL|nr:MULTISPECIES: class I SAM-dependent methyltransferase [Brevibacillus]MCR8985187.1 class I SAM-dependent methyltransferase [Brevibacillus laterosporus]MCZ0830916.1 methyltransferase domain-containing protein [Brevibacillus halotolerans]
MYEKGWKQICTHFHNPLLKEAYKAREATDSWIDKMLEVIQPKGLQVLDAGCGGGIYTRAWADLGAKRVTAMDFSEGCYLLHRKSAIHIHKSCII